MVWVTVCFIGREETGLNLWRDGSIKNISYGSKNSI